MAVSYARFAFPALASAENSRRTQKNLHVTGAEVIARANFESSSTPAVVRAERGRQSVLMRINYNLRIIFYHYVSIGLLRL
jgi:hypothetical protein